MTRSSPWTPSRLELKLICALLDAPAARRHDGRGRRRLRRHGCHLRRRGGHETHLAGRGRRGPRAGRDGHRRRPPRDDWRGWGRVAPAHGVNVHDGLLSRAASNRISLPCTTFSSFVSARFSNRVFPRLLHSIRDSKRPARASQQRARWPHGTLEKPMLCECQEGPVESGSLEPLLDSYCGDFDT